MFSEKRKTNSEEFDYRKLSTIAISFSVNPERIISRFDSTTYIDLVLMDHFPVGFSIALRIVDIPSQGYEKGSMKSRRIRVSL